MSTASDTTTRRQKRVLFADRVIQQTTFNKGLKNYIVLEGGNYGGAMTYPAYHLMRDGAIETTLEEYQGYIDSVPDKVTPDTNTEPDAPTDIIAVAGDGLAIISFTVPENDGGSPITSYTVTSNPPGFTITGSSSPLTITGLTNGVSYTFTVIATNAIGNSISSTPSGSITPNPRTRGNVQFATSFYDNADSGYTSLNNTLGKMCSDSAGNIYVAGYYRTDTLTINKPDSDGISQISELTESFNGTISVSQSGTTYYTNNLFVTKYSSAGVPLWSATVGGDTNKGNTFYGICCDSNNNVYALYAHSVSNVTFNNADGTAFGSINNVFGFGSFTPGRYTLVKYNSSGVIQWINSITAGDNNSQFLLITAGNLHIDSNNNIYLSGSVQRAGGGTGPSAIKFYQYSSVSAGVVQDTLITVDSYAFGGSPAQYHRGFLVKLNTSGVYDWNARMVIPTAWGENNGGTLNGNVVSDASGNVYLCLNSNQNASSPTVNIYSGVSMTTNPLTLTSPYYRIDLRGNSISPSLPQYYRFAAIVKFNSSGVYQSTATAHQLINGSVGLNMTPFIGINKATNTLYMAINAQGYVGTNAGSGAQLDTLYVDSFSSNVVNGSDYDVSVSNTFNVTLAQPQAILAVIKYNTNMVAQAVAYIDTPPTSGSFPNTPGNTGSDISIDTTGNVYIATSIKDTTNAKTIYTFDSLVGATPSFNTFGTVSATAATNDGLVISFSDDLTDVNWATTITSSDNLNDNALTSVVDSNDYIYVGGTATLDKTQTTNTIAINEYDTVTGGAITTTLFGNLAVTDATDRASFIIKYE
jgi:hypothetical protein